MEHINAKCRKIKQEDLEKIMNWRMMPEITKYMNTDPQLTLEGQQKWFEKISKKENEFHWVLEVDEEPIGYVSLVDWDKHNNIIHTGVYIAVKEKRSMVLAVNLQLSMYEFAFEKLGVNKVSMEILGNNKNVISLNERLGAVREGILRQEIKKGEDYYDLYLLGVLKQEWQQIKNKIKYSTIEFEE